MKKVLITGVAGMIGSHLAEELLKRKEYEIIGIDNLSYGSINNIKLSLENENFKFYKLDVLDIDALKILCRDVDIIIHLAAVKKISEKESSIPTLQVNVQGTENLLNIAKIWNCKFIFASTSDVYGMSNDLPFREDGDLLLGPSMVKRWSYAVSKLYCEQLVFAYNKEYNVPFVILRYFGGFSPRSSFTWVGGHIPIFINAVLKDEEVIIHGDGKQTRSMGYIEDIIDGTIKAIELPQAEGEIINIGNDEEMSVIDAAYLIHKHSNTKKELKLKFVKMEEVFGKYKDIMRRKPDLRKSFELLGYKPMFSMEESIKKCIAVIKKENNIT